MNELANELVQRTLHRERSQELLHSNPDVAVELLLLAREKGGRDRFRDFDQKWFERSFPPQHAVDLLDRSSDAATSVLDNDRWLSGFCNILSERLNSDGSQTVLSNLPLGLVRRIEWAVERSGNPELLREIQLLVRGSEEESRLGSHGPMRFRRPPLP
jgi:hypothetical protein